MPDAGGWLLLGVGAIVASTKTGDALDELLERLLAQGLARHLLLDEAQGQRDAQKTISESLTSSYLEYLYLTGLKDRQGTIYVPTNPANGLPLFRDTR